MAYDVPNRQCGCPTDGFHNEETCKRGVAEARRLNQMTQDAIDANSVPVPESETVRKDDPGVPEKEWITLKDIEAWLRYHGLNMNRVRALDICREGIHMNHARCYIRAEVYKEDSQGKMFADWSFGSLRYRGSVTDRVKEAAFEVLWIPLRRLPGQV